MGHLDSYSVLPLTVFQEGSALKVWVALGSLNSPWDERDASEGWLCPLELNHSLRDSLLTLTWGGYESFLAVCSMPGSRWDEIRLFPSVREKRPIPFGTRPGTGFFQVKINPWG